MTTQRLGLIMNGVTGRMGLNQHLIRSIVAIREQDARAGILERVEELRLRVAGVERHHHPPRGGDPGVDLEVLVAVVREDRHALAGLDPRETLMAATSVGALGIGLDGVTGRIASGLAADLLLVEGDPLDDLAVLTAPVAVLAAGRPVDGLPGSALVS